MILIQGWDRDVYVREFIMTRTIEELIGNERSTSLFLH
jgi:hypothetical protein